jgi:hypothetical protein
MCMYIQLWFYNLGYMSLFIKFIWFYYYLFTGFHQIFYQKCIIVKYKIWSTKNYYMKLSCTPHINVIFP